MSIFVSARVRICVSMSVRVHVINLVEVIWRESTRDWVIGKFGFIEARMFVFGESS